MKSKIGLKTPKLIISNPLQYFEIAPNAQIYKPSALIFSTRKLDFLIIHVFLLVGEILYPIGAIENL